MKTTELATPIIALAGNPNVGKSTLFNRLTGMNQHTGNWPGKTVSLAQGTSKWHGQKYTFVDLPGTYSLRSRSPEEEVAQSFLESGDADCVIIVCDATALERNLILAQQVLALHRKAVLCVNLIDEAEKSNIRINTAALAKLLGIPVIATAASSGRELDSLMEAVHAVTAGKRDCSPRYTAADKSSADLITQAETLASACVIQETSSYRIRQLHWDRLLTNRVTGIAAMVFLLLLTVWLTIWGANYPSTLLQQLFQRGGTALSSLFIRWNLPSTLSSVLLDGIYDTVTRVVSVMLPPMAIFFPLFTLLENIGYLPRAAFLLDHRLAKCGTCGKHALTMCMGLGCNAVGVTGCRIIDSQRERLIAILTASFLPCNGRFPTLILLAAILFPGRGLVSALLIAISLILAIFVTMGISWLLSRTLLKGSASGFVMELPPYRKPRVGEVIVRSLLDRTLFVLGRAVVVAAPAGAVIWLAAHVEVGGNSILAHASMWLHPLGTALGLSGPILLAFLLGFPANELVVPVLVMLLTGAQTLGGNAGISEVLVNHGLTGISAVCMMVFCLFHWPCGTTLLTIHRETKSLPWTLCAFALPTLLGITLCFLVQLIA